MIRVLCLGLLCFVVGGCGDPELREDVCGVELAWNGEVYDGFDVKDAPALGSQLGEGARIRCGGKSEATQLAELWGVDPAIAVAALPPSMYSDRVSLWVLRGSREARAVAVASCLGWDASANVRFVVGDVGGMAYFSANRSRESGRWAEWSVVSTPYGLEVELESRNLRARDADRVERCAR
jgi:hypothetical protein